jgi:hypothetical protein
MNLERNFECYTEWFLSKFYRALRRLCITLKITGVLDFFHFYIAFRRYSVIKGLMCVTKSVRIVRAQLPCEIPNREHMKTWKLFERSSEAHAVRHDTGNGKRCYRNTSAFYEDAIISCSLVCDQETAVLFTQRTSIKSWRASKHNFRS